MVNKKTKNEVLESLYGCNKNRINTFIGKVISDEWFMLAIENDMFNLSIWEQKGNISGARSFYGLIKKFNSEIFKDQINNILNYTLDINNNVNFRIITDLVSLYNEYNLIPKLVKYLNYKILHDDNYNVFCIEVIYHTLISEVVIDNNNYKNISSVLINLINTCKIEFCNKKMFLNHFLLKGVSEYFVDNLDKIYFFDLNGYDFVNDNQMNNKLDKKKKEYDYLFQNVDSWLSLNCNEKFYHRNYYSYFFIEYAKINNDKNIIISLFNFDYVYYFKIGLHIIYNCLEKYQAIDLINKIGYKEEYLKNVSTSFLYSNLLFKYWDDINNTIKEGVKKTFISLKNNQHSSTLLYSYNLLSNNFKDVDIKRDEIVSKIMPREGLSETKRSVIEEESFLSEKDIVENFEKSLENLNDLYGKSLPCENGVFKEKNYKATINYFKNFIDKNRYLLLMKNIDKLNINVILDFKDLIEYDDFYCYLKTVVDKVLIKSDDNIDYSKIFDFLVECAKDTEFSFLNFDDFYDIFEIVYNAEFELNDSNEQFGNDYLTMYINTYVVKYIELLLILTNNNKKQLFKMFNRLINGNKLVCVASLAYYIKYFSSFMDKKYIKLFDDKSKEVFFAIYVTIGVIDKKSLTFMKDIFTSFIQKPYLIIKNDKLYKCLGKIIGYVYCENNLYDDLVKLLLSKLKDNNMEYIVIIDGMLNYYNGKKRLNCTQEKKIVHLLKEILELYFFRNKISVILLNDLIKCANTLSININSLEVIRLLIEQIKNCEKPDEYIIYSFLKRFKSVEVDSSFENEHKRLCKELESVLENMNSCYIELLQS